MFFKPIALFAVLASGASAQSRWNKLSSVCVPQSAQSGRRNLKPKTRKGGKTAKGGKTMKGEGQKTKNKGGEKKPKKAKFPKSPTVVDVTRGIEEVSVFGEMLGRLTPLYREEFGPFTIFAPPNDVFENVTEWSRWSILSRLPSENVTTAENNFLASTFTYLVRILNYHTRRGRAPEDLPDLEDEPLLMASDITDGLQVNVQFFDDILEFKVEDGVVTVNGTEVIETDIEATNGVVHIVDGMIVEPIVGFVDARPDICIWCNLQPQTLLSNLYGATLVIAECGYIFNNDGATIEDDVEVDTNACLFDALIYGNYTLFAPTNNFLTADVVEGALNATGLDGVTALLSNHIVEGTYLASDIYDGFTLNTVSNETIGFNVTDDGVFVNGIPIVNPDMVSSNGVFHAIDGVIVFDPES